MWLVGWLVGWLAGVLWWRYDDDDNDDVDNDDNDDKGERGAHTFVRGLFSLQTGHCFAAVWRPPLSCLPKSHSTNRWLPLDKKVFLSNGKIAGRALPGRFSPQVWSTSPTLLFTDRHGGANKHRIRSNKLCMQNNLCFHEKDLEYLLSKLLLLPMKWRHQQASIK